MAPSLSEQLGLTEADVIGFHSATLHSSILGIFCHAIYTSVYVYAICAIVSSKSHSESSYMTKGRVVHGILITVIWILATVYTGVVWYFLDATYIVHGATRETAFDFNITDFADPWIIVSRVCRAINVLIADSIIIWRCFVIHGGSWLVVVLPSLCVLTGTICCIFQLITNFSSAEYLATLAQINWRMIYYGLSVATNVLCTLLIVIRILRVTGIAGVKTYRGVIEILVESAMLYSAMYIVYIIVETNAFYDVNVNESELFPGAMLSAITGIAPTLIIARVASGHARPDHTWRHNVSFSTSSRGVSTTLPSMLRFRTTQTVSGRQTEGIVDLAGSMSSRTGTEPTMGELEKKAVNTPITVSEV